MRECKTCGIVKDDDCFQKDFITNGKSYKRKHCRLCEKEKYDRKKSRFNIEKKRSDALLYKNDAILFINKMDVLKRGYFGIIDSYYLIHHYINIFGYNFDKIHNMEVEDQLLYYWEELKEWNKNDMNLVENYKKLIDIIKGTDKN
jgi:hypothetical protein